MPVPSDEIDKATSFCFSDLANKEGLTPRKLIKELKLIAFSDPADHSEIAEGGELRFKTFGEQGKKRRAIKKLKEKTIITESKDGNIISKISTVDFELHSKMEAIDAGLNIHGMKKPLKVKADLNGSIMAAVAGYLSKARNQPKDDKGEDEKS